MHIRKDCVHQRYVYRVTEQGVDKRKPPKATGDRKRCPGCKQALPKHCFGSNAAKAKGLNAYRFSCHNRTTRNNIANGVGSTRNHHLRRRYGLTEDDVDVLIRQQGGACAICCTGKPEHVDHCHRTGKVRGVLCFNCDGGLGQFKDDVDRLINAIAYLEEKSWIEPVEPVGFPPST